LARLAEFEPHVQFHSKVINDTKRLKRHVDRHDPYIYPGAFVTCVYDADRALCRRSDGKEGSSLPDCMPLRCRNVILTGDNADAFRATWRPWTAPWQAAMRWRPSSATGSNSVAPSSPASWPPTAHAWRARGSHDDRPGPAHRR
jgi:hypothetical protein